MLKSWPRIMVGTISAPSPAAPQHSIPHTPFFPFDICLTSYVPPPPLYNVTLVSKPTLPGSIASQVSLLCFSKRKKEHKTKPNKKLIAF